MKILLAEDDIDLGNVLSHFLEVSGYEVFLVRDGEEAYNSFNEYEPDICLLDVMMPGMDGFTLAEKIRKKDGEVPIVFLTAKNQKNDRITGLKLGADDYITKPFEVEELLLRIKNILKRSAKVNAEVLKIKDATLSQNRLSIGNKQFRLTQKEVELAHLLFRNKNRVLKREDILKELWGENDYFLGRSMDVFMARLRKYFSNADGVSIETIRGTGYIFHVE